MTRYRTALLMSSGPELDPRRQLELLLRDELLAADVAEEDEREDHQQQVGAAREQEDLPGLAHEVGLFLSVGRTISVVAR